MRQDRRWEIFECQQCGRCCTEIGLPYDPKRIFDISKFLRLSVDEVISKYYGQASDDRKYWVSDDTKRTPCPFLKQDGDRKTCTIYEVRPEGCRLYPFDTDCGRQGVDCPGAKLVFEKLEERQCSDNQLAGNSHGRSH